MKNCDLNEKNIQISDPIESYFECLSFCDISDSTCKSQCVEILREYEN